LTNDSGPTGLQAVCGRGRGPAQASGVVLNSCSAGMIIKTDTPKLRKARQTVLEMLLIHHPLDCPICDKAGNATFRTLPMNTGSPRVASSGTERRRLQTCGGHLWNLLPTDASSAANACASVRTPGTGALGFIGRGFSTVVQPAFGEILQCDYCGQCIDICPTGALLSKPMKFCGPGLVHGRKDTICPFCGCGCTLTLGLRKGRY